MKKSYQYINSCWNYLCRLNSCIWLAVAGGTAGAYMVEKSR
ncbi:MAG: hypothetical protein AB8V03_04940 [Francisella endosymbiont of Hyalomma asiaticum]